MDVRPAPLEGTRLVAEEVMGWHISDDGHIGAGEGPWSYRCVRPSPVRGADLWEPFTNIAHAWEVVERLRSLRFHVSLYHSGETPTAPCWVTISQLDREWRACGDTAAEAICRAALTLFCPT